MTPEKKRKFQRLIKVGKENPLSVLEGFHLSPFETLPYPNGEGNFMQYILSQLAQTSGAEANIWESHLQSFINTFPHTVATRLSQSTNNILPLQYAIKMRLNKAIDIILPAPAEYPVSILDNVVESTSFYTHSWWNERIPLVLEKIPSFSEKIEEAAEAFLKINEKNRAVMLDALFKFITDRKIQISKDIMRHDAIKELGSERRIELELLLLTPSGFSGGRTRSGL